MLDIRVKRGAELSSDHHLVVRLKKNNNAYMIVQDYKVLLNKVEGPCGQRCKEDVCRQHVLFSESSRNVQQRWSGSCSKHLLLHPLLRYVDGNDSA